MAATMHTLVNFAPNPSLSLGSSYRNRDVRSYGILGMARQHRSRFANALKRRNQTHDVRILRTTIHDDGTVTSEWIS
ncbi:hypothetical protein SEA_REINDEER_9 [Mycobacterium phage Reindeer]|uniref:Uncharacterized protein n=1 Tax=Mycobacterium phage Reindeer TaxID=2762283 RepID=A0A7G8LHU7_9CAUD|nr:hypothetical protein J4U05_gp009 [Mycobacterium phage Reindeer]QNJ56819.1 hypothetical protein SEA_REINDEER_9 [Mycobacterium phage Reindeer]